MNTVDLWEWMITGAALSQSSPWGQTLYYYPESPRIMGITRIIFTSISFLCGRIQKKIIFRGCWSKWISLACSFPSLPLATGLWAVTYGERERTWPHSALAVHVCCFSTEKRWAVQSHLPKWHYPLSLIPQMDLRAVDLQPPGCEEK